MNYKLVCTNCRTLYDAGTKRTNQSCVKCGGQIFFTGYTSKDFDSLPLEEKKRVVVGVQPQVAQEKYEDIQVKKATLGGIFGNLVMGRAESRLFENLAGGAEKLREMIVTEMQLKNYPLQVEVAEVKGSWGYFAQTEKCLLIDLGNSNKLCISAISVGTYLYVGVYILVSNVAEKLGMNMLVKDVFQQQKLDALFAVALDIVDTACEKMGLRAIER